MSQLNIDMTRCGGRGICILVAPELLELDRFGYPVMIGTIDGPNTERAARHAVRACPTQALSILEDEGLHTARAESVA
jgi:ferredoxin